jgi:hypothetical protein
VAHSKTEKTLYDSHDLVGGCPEFVISKLVDDDLGISTRPSCSVDREPLTGASYRLVFQ